MKKTERQRIIKQLILQNDIETQDELLRLLRQEGVTATQATVSRDTKELRIVKTYEADGRTKYTLLPEEKSSDNLHRLKESLYDSLKRVECIEFIVVIHTDMGGADVVTNYLDQVDYPEIAGTVAGVDTIIIITYSPDAAQQLVKKIQALI